MKIDHWQHIVLLIRAQIDISEGNFDEDEPDALDSENSSSSSQFRNIVLGAKQKPLSFSAIESTHSEDSAFKKFRERFCKFLSIVLPVKSIVAYKSIFAQDAMVSKIVFTMAQWELGLICGYRFRSTDTSKSPMNPKSPGKLLPIIFAVIPISKRSHAMTVSLSTPPQGLYSPN